MPVKLDEHAIERSVYAIIHTFKDEDDASAVPTAVAWTLTDCDGNIVNARSAVSASAATSVTIVMKGTDLSIIAGQTNERLFLLEWTYTSGYGSGLPGKEQMSFIIDDLKAVS